MTEHEAQGQITDWLRAEKIPFIRNQVGKMKARKRYVKFGEVGMPDLLCFPKVRCEFARAGEAHPFPLWIEIKSATGKLAPDQEAWRDYLLGIGHGWVLARSVDEVENWLRDHASR